MGKIIQSLKKDKTLHLNIVYLIVIGIILIVFLKNVIPLLPHILPHPDEGQFYGNAWSILSGKQLTNFLHVAFTEYSLAAFLALMNIVTKTGTNFPQGIPTVATYFFGRVFGLILMLLTYLIGCLLLQKDEKNIKPRLVIFTALFFGSLGVFERFIRVNSDSMSIFVFLNYLLLSVWFHKRQAPPFQFFLLNLFFIFLSSFTNFKALYLDFPLFAINSLVPFLWYQRPSNQARLPSLYRLALYSIGVVAGTVLFWSVFIPRPVNYKTFWYNIKNATVQAIIHEYEYPDMARNSGAFYLYDLLANQLGFSMVAGIVLLLGFSFIVQRKRTIITIFSSTIGRLRLTKIKEGFPDRYLELILVLTFFSYLIGAGFAVTHFSRWGTPLAVLFLLFISSFLEQFLLIITTSIRSWPAKAILFVFIFILSWNLMFALFEAIKVSNYPSENGFKLTVDNVADFIGSKHILPQDEANTVGWNIFTTKGLRNISLDDLILPENANIKYLLWPYWNLSVLYDKSFVNKENHNQTTFINNYAQKVEFRFPSIMSKYMHLAKIIAWQWLRLTWYPEIENFTESQYAAITLKKTDKPINFTYEVPFSALEHSYDSTSDIFSLATLPDSYVFPQCTSNPYVLNVSDGQPPPASTNPYNPSRNVGFYCHSFTFRIMPRGIYKIQFKGLPKNDPDLRIYSPWNYGWDPKTQTLDFKADYTIVTIAFGVAGHEKEMPDLKLIVNYTMTQPTPTPTPTPAFK